MKCDKYNKSLFCRTCCLAKSHKLHFKHIHDNHYTLFALLYVDLWTFFIISNTCAHYFMLVVDDSTIYTWIFKKNKDEAQSLFCSFMHMVKRDFDIKIRAIPIQLDGDKEFLFLSKLGFIRR